MLLKLIFLLAVIEIKNGGCTDIQNIFDLINKETLNFNAVGADIGWQALINPDNPKLAGKSRLYQNKRMDWQNRACKQLAILYFDNLLNETQRRQTYLLCRGSKFTYEEIREIGKLYEEIQFVYNVAKVCLPIKEPLNNLSDLEDAILKYLSKMKTYTSRNKNGEISKKYCLVGEQDVGNFMKITKNESVLRWVWLKWRENMKQMRSPYFKMVDIENVGAKRNGYEDIGEVWRDELEITNLRAQCYQLYVSILPLYKLIHGVVRYQLRKYYGNIVPENGPIPAHLLGDLWSQDWETLAELISPQTINLDDRIKNVNWTVEHMVKRAEDFYLSLGLPAMTDIFWRESMFSRVNNSIRCHGTAADMFKDGDYRLLYCLNITNNYEDFYVIHHEMGHLQYYMAYKNLPALFRQANTALHESIGDAIMLGVNTPQHLYRLGLINDNELYNNNSEMFNEREDGEINMSRIGNTGNFIIENIDKSNNNDGKEFSSEYTTFNRNVFKKDEVYSNFENMYLMKSLEQEPPKDNRKFLRHDDGITTDDILMLKQALNKIPQIPFSLALEEYRWRLFEGTLSLVNDDFWKLSRELQGIEPIGYRGEEYFDIGAKYHVAENVPYARYFISYFLQYQLFEKLCKSAVFGRSNNKPLPRSMKLHRCDIYGSKAAGKMLKDIMSRGSSQHWQEILHDTATIDLISADSIIQYYHPVYSLLTRLVKKYDIPIGW